MFNNKKRKQAELLTDREISLFNREKRQEIEKAS